MLQFPAAPSRSLARQVARSLASSLVNRRKVRYHFHNRLFALIQNLTTKGAVLGLAGMSLSGE
eukprot:11713310-Alexandrium_andersonii.AAC.1